ncbi:hypothetical protein FRB99_009025 [Tulasnella sp. 403]|nr:hypothetical protein FRB99_009025 [Tulasnella sp. 403]
MKARTPALAHHRVIQQHPCQARKEEFVSSVIELIGRLELGTLLLLTGVDLSDRPEAHMGMPTFHLIPTQTKAQDLPPALTQLVEHVPPFITTTHPAWGSEIPIIPGSGLTRRIITSLPSGGTFPPTGVILEYTLEGDNRADARMLASAAAKCVQKELGVSGKAGSQISGTNRMNVKTSFIAIVIWDNKSVART